LASVHAIQQHCTRHRLVESGNEVCKCTLATPTWPHQCDHLALPCRERNVGKHGLRFIREAHVPEFQRLPARRGLTSTPVERTLGRRLENLEQALRRCE